MAVMGLCQTTQFHPQREAQNVFRELGKSPLLFSDLATL